MPCSTYSSEKYACHETFLSRASVAERTILNGASVTKIHSKLVLEPLRAYDLAEVLW